MIFLAIFVIAFIVFIISKKISWCPHTSSEDRAQFFMQISIVVMMISFSSGVMSMVFEKNKARHCQTYLNGSLKLENKRDWNYEEVCIVYKTVK